MILWCFQRGGDDSKSGIPASGSLDDDWLGFEWETGLVGRVRFSRRVCLDPWSHHFSPGKVWWVDWGEMMALETMVTVVMMIEDFHLHAHTHTHTDRRNSSTRGTTATTLGLKTESFTSRKLVFSSHMWYITMITMRIVQMSKLKTITENSNQDDIDRWHLRRGFSGEHYLNLTLTCQLLLYFLKKKTNMNIFNFAYNSNQDFLENFI